MNLSDLIKEIQFILQSVNRALTIDGIWGPQTLNTYTKAPPKVKQRVDLVAAQAGFTVKKIVASLGTSSSAWATVDTVHQAVVHALMDLDPGLTIAAAEELIPANVLQIEARMVGDRVFLRSLLVTPTSHAAGPFQFEPAEWNQVWMQYPEARKYMAQYPNATDYVEDTANGKKGSPGDLNASAYAFAGELLDIQRALEEHDLPVTGPTTYTLHNQGVNGGIAFLKGERSINNHQSYEAINTMLLAQRQVNSATSQA